MSTTDQVGPGEPQRNLLAGLIEGNRRFAEGRPRLGAVDPTTRSELVGGQSPQVAVLACSDSRVGPELVFDEGLGGLFVVRVAGNVVDDVVLGSLEYAVEHLGVPLILVMGHSHCGAVTSACACRFEELKGATGVVLRAVEAAVEQARATHYSPEELIDAVARANVEIQMGALFESPVIRGAVAEGALALQGAWYELEDGLVTWL